ncbi:hypothetical protein L249_7461, partial [Ophiocordyceps polyrhachis-furcata BCC 54312]
PPQRPESQWGYSGHSARSTRSRHIDRRAVLIAVIALDQSDRRAVPIAVIAPDLDSRTKFIISFNFITSSIQSPLLPSILLQSSQNHHHVIRLLLLYHVIHTLITHYHFHCRK